MAGGKRGVSCDKTNDDDGPMSPDDATNKEVEGHVTYVRRALCDVARDCAACR